ncbi:MAG: 50S ribosomal protein L6 [Candidatus Bathyarchaeia archaeon]
MSLTEVLEKEVAIPENVQLTLSGKVVEVKGPLGTLVEDLSHLPLELAKRGDKLSVKAVWPRKKERALIGTAYSAISNMIKGVTSGFTYRLKVVYAHFPVTIKVDKARGLVLIENFIGEKVARKARICGQTEVEVKGDEVIVKGLRKQDVSQTASNIENATRIKRKDQRVFLDGIYVYEKGEGLSP